MIDCSPSSGNPSPKARVSHFKKIRDNLRQTVENLRSEVSSLETSASDLNESNKNMKIQIKNKKRELSNYSSTLDKLESKSQNLNFEYSSMTESVIRYQKMSQIMGPMPIFHDFCHEIEDLRNEIIEKEKEIIECNDQLLLAQKLTQVQLKRASLIQNDAKLLERLNFLTVQLSILQYAGDQKLITDSEYIIEKQLTSEELRDELENLIKRKQISKAEETSGKKSISWNPKSSQNIESKLFQNDDPVYSEIDQISTELDAIRSKLNFYLKSDRKVDDLEKSKRKFSATLEDFDAKVDKHKREFDDWCAKRDEFVRNDEFLQAQVDVIARGECVSGREINDFLKAKQKLFKSIKKRRVELAESSDSLTIDKISANSQLYAKKIGQINSEIAGLNRAREVVAKRQKTFERLNSLHGIRQIQQAERSVHKAESEVDQLVMNLSKVRRRKKELNKQIRKSLSTLSDLGIAPPPFMFKPRKSIADS